MLDYVTRGNLVCAYVTRVYRKSANLVLVWKEENPRFKKLSLPLSLFLQDLVSTHVIVIPKRYAVKYLPVRNTS